MNRRIGIFTLTARTEQALEQIGVSKRMQLEYRREGFMKIREYLEKRKQKYYVAKDVKRFVDASYGRYKRNKISKRKFYRIRKSAAMLEEYYHNNKLKWRSLPDLNYRAFPKQFQKVVEDYEKKMQETGTLSNSTITGYKYDIYHLLNYLGDRGNFDFSKITLKLINNFIPAISKIRPRSMRHLLIALRSFARYLNQSHQSRIDILPALQGTPARHKKVIPGFTWEEANRIVSSIDTSAATGKRDYAMLLLAKNTSLRGIDIVNLKLDELNWHLNKIVITQRKTGGPLELPLEPDVGNAIADYIINARPQIDIPYIFLTSNHPFSEMCSGNLNKILMRYLDLNGIGHVKGEYKGVHSFRRSFAARMLDKGIPLQVVTNILGHKCIDSTTPYLSADFARLRICALDLNDIPVKQGELQ